MKEFLWQFYESIISLIQCTLTIHYTFKFNAHEIKSLKEKIKFILVIAGLFATVTIANTQFGNFEGLFIFVYPVEIFLTTFFIFKTNPFIKILSSLSSILCVAAVNAVAFLFVSQFAKTSEQLIQSDNIYRFALSLIAQVLLAVVYKIILYFVKKERLSLSKYELSLLSFILTFSTIFLVFSISTHLKQKLPQSIDFFFFVADCGVIFLSIIAFYIIIKINSANKLKSENEHLMHFKKQQEIYIANIKTDFDEIKRIKHDVRQAFDIISGLSSVEDIRGFIKDNYSQNIFLYSNAVNCKDVYLNALLNVKFIKARNLNIKVFAQIIENTDDFDSSALCFLIGNLIDNAIEACTGLDNSVIDFIIEQNQGDLNIIIKNTIPLNYTNYLLKTTKQNKTEHGYGLKIIKNIVERYKGSDDFFIKDDMFVAIITLKNPS